MCNAGGLVLDGQILLSSCLWWCVYVFCMTWHAVDFLLMIIYCQEKTKFIYVYKSLLDFFFVFCLSHVYSVQNQAQIVRRKIKKR